MLFALNKPRSRKPNNNHGDHALVAWKPKPGPRESHAFCTSTVPPFSFSEFERSTPEMEFCPAESIWDKTPVGVTEVVSCQRMGGYYGSLKRHCGSFNGQAVWFSIEGECQPYSKIGFGVIAFILVLIVVVCRITYRIITKNSDTKSKTELPLYTM